MNCVYTTLAMNSELPYRRKQYLVDRGYQLRFVTRVFVVVLIVAVVMMLLVFGQIPITDTIVARYAASEWRSRVYAVKFLLSLTVAAAAVPMLAVVHHATGGFYWVFMILAGLAAVVTALAFAMPSRRLAPAAAE